MRPAAQLLRLLLPPLAMLMTVAAAVPMLAQAGWGLSLQTTASMPVGLYLLVPVSDLRRGDIVVLTPPNAVRTMMEERGWIGPGVLLMKEVVALGGDQACIKAGEMTINGVASGLVRSTDRFGRPLPNLEFCRALEEDEAFLLGWNGDGNSFDSRYFGPVPRNRFTSKAIKL